MIQLFRAFSASGGSAPEYLLISRALIILIFRQRKRRTTKIWCTLRNFWNTSILHSFDFKFWGDLTIYPKFFGLRQIGQCFVKFSATLTKRRHPKLFADPSTKASCWIAKHVCNSIKKLPPPESFPRSDNFKSD